MGNPLKLVRTPSPLDLAEQARAEAWSNFNPRLSHQYPENDFVSVSLAHSKYHKAYIAEHGEEPSDPITNCILNYSSWVREGKSRLVIEHPGQTPHVPNWVWADFQELYDESEETAVVA